MRFIFDNLFVSLFWQNKAKVVSQFAFSISVIDIITFVIINTVTNNGEGEYVNIALKLIL